MQKYMSNMILTTSFSKIQEINHIKAQKAGLIEDFALFLCKYSPINALDIFNVPRKGIEQLYEFYARKIIYMNENLKLGLRGSDLFANFIKRQMNNTGIIKTLQSS